MRASIIRKEASVKDFQAKLENAKSFIVVEYLGLTVAQITELRTQLRENGMEMKVYQNNITRKATADLGFDDLASTLVGPNAVVFSYEDELAIAKILANFAKENEALKFKSGVIAGEFKNVEELQVLASLPSRDELLATFAAMLNSPLLKFAIGLKEIAKTKDAE